MALTRKLLKSFGLGDEIIDSIIEAHTESTDALKQQRDDALAKAAQVDELTAQLNEANQKLTTTDDAAQIRQEFDAYKAAVEGEKTYAKKQTALRELLKERVGIKRDGALKLIMAAENMDDYELDGEQLKNAADIEAAMKQKHAEWVGETITEGIPPVKPPVGGNEPVDAFMKGFDA